MKTRIFYMVMALVLTAALAVPLLSPGKAVTARSALKTQLAMILDGSVSISSSDWDTIIDGLAAAVGNSSCVLQDGSVELTVVQFGGTSAQLEVGPVVINGSNVVAVTANISAMTQMQGFTPMACGICLAADTLAGSPNFDPALKQALNLVTDGVPNVCCCSGDPPGDYSCNYDGLVCYDGQDSAECARDYALDLLEMTEDQDEFDAEGIGITIANKDWLKGNIVWPQPGYDNWLPTGPGWVRVVDTFQDFADTICEKIKIVVEPTGACCNPATEICTDVIADECQAPLEWNEGKSCAEIVCVAPPEELDFGDAPEEGEAYPSSGVIGKFPTCITVGIPLNWIQHGLGLAHFAHLAGPQPPWDAEPDGNAGLCPGCFPTYDDDECYLDGDAGLMFPEPYTINATGAVVTCPNSTTGTLLGLTCQQAVWGTDVDIFVVNNMPNRAVGYVNVLMDWNQDGQWALNVSTTCPAANPTPVIPEHVVVNQLIPAGYIGPLSGVPGGVPTFTIGPNPGYVWTRFTISEIEVPVLIDNNHIRVGDNNVNHIDWHGEGIFEDGETEDYLLRIDEALPEMTIDKDVVGGAPVGVAPGGTVQYTINVTNSGIGTAMNVSIWDTLPTWFTYASTASIVDTGTTRSPTVNPTPGVTNPLWGYWTIPSGDSVVITFTADVDSNIPVGTYQNTAYANGDNFTQIDDLGDVAGAPYGGDEDTPPGQDPKVDEDVFVAEEPPPLITGVPTLSQWGMIAMGILFAAFLIWTVRRRWVVSADGRQE